MALSLLLLAVGHAVASPAPRPTIEILSPRPGQRVGPEGVEVMLRFRDDADPLASATFRALLNGADVTPELTTAENGAVGRLHGLLDGDNILRVEVFVRSSGLFAWLDRGWLTHESREVHILSRRPLQTDQG